MFVYIIIFSLTYMVLTNLEVLFLQFVLVETVITSLMDRFKKLRDYKLITVITLCCIFFLLGLTLTTNVSEIIFDFNELICLEPELQYIVALK